jgi:hypothetical protein
MQLWEKVKRLLGRVSGYIPSFSIGKRLSDVGGAVQRAVGNITAYPPKVDSFLKQYGKNIVQNVTIRRTPIKSFITRALDFLSFGKFSELKKQYGYDEFYHLSMVFDFTDDNGIMRTAVLEKNQIINLSLGYSNEATTEIMKARTPENLSIETMMENTRKMMGDANFFTYDAFQNNCQIFLMNVLRANGMLTDILQKFVLQPVDELVKKLPGYVAPVARALTDVAAIGDLTIQNQ